MKSDDVTIRRAQPADALTIQTIIAAAYERYVPRIGRRPAPMDVDYAALIDATDDVDVLVDGTEVVGVLACEATVDHLSVGAVAVTPSAHGRGYGRRLLAHAERKAAMLGLGELRLYTNAAMTENLEFYPHLGYEEVERRSEDGFDRVYFRKRLR